MSECILPVNGGKECYGFTEEKQPCANGKLSDWSDWSKCNGIESYRTRKCNDPIGNGEPCVGFTSYLNTY